MDEIVQFDFPTDSPKIIKVIGVGGGGGNAVNHMYREGIHDVTFVLCNTDNQALAESPVPVKLQLGQHDLKVAISNSELIYHILLICVLLKLHHICKLEQASHVGRLHIYQSVTVCTVGKYLIKCLCIVEIFRHGDLQGSLFIPSAAKSSKAANEHRSA